jgi:hypothetical protein
MIPNQEKGSLSLDAMQEVAINVVELFCSIICRPVEIILRFRHGSRYFSPTVIALSSLMMIVVPALLSFTSAIGGMIPFTHFQPPRGMFSLGDFAVLYFLLSLFHGLRIYRLMIWPEKELHSEFEGPPWFFIRLIPGTGSWWLTRIAIEPALIFIAATLLENIYIIQSGLSNYLHIAAFALLMRSFISWYRSWEFLRRILDSRAAGPIIARLVEDTASQDELAQIHLANFPRNISPEDRKTAARYIARAFNTQGADHETH